MNTTSRVALAVLFSALAAQGAAAQWNNARLGNGRNRIYMTVGLDPALISTIGYARVVPVLGHDFQLATDVGLVTARLDTHDFRARVEVQSPVVRWQSVQLSGAAAFITRGTQNVVYRGLDFGADLTGTLGVYRRGWFAAAQFGKDKDIISHITNSQWYRDNAYEGAKDGWYLDCGGTFHYGLTAGVTVGRTELVGRAGFRQTEDWNPITPPFYGSLGIGVPF